MHQLSAGLPTFQNGKVGIMMKTQRFLDCIQMLELPGGIEKDESQRSRLTRECGQRIFTQVYGTFVK